jgi:hypothetical protein
MALSIAFKTDYRLMKFEHNSDWLVEESNHKWGV